MSEKENVKKKRCKHQKSFRTGEHGFLENLDMFRQETVVHVLHGFVGSHLKQEDDIEWDAAEASLVFLAHVDQWIAQAVRCVKEMEPVIITVKIL